MIDSPVTLSLLCTIAHIPGLSLRYAPFSGKIKPKQRTVLFIIYALALVANFAIYLALELTTGTNVAFFKANLLVFWSLSALVNAVVIRNTPWEHLFSCGLVSVILIMLFSVGAYVQLRLPFVSVNTSLNIANLVTIVLAAALYRPLKKLMVTTVEPFLSDDSKDYRRDLGIVPVAMALACFLALPFHEDIGNGYQLVSRLMIGVATLFICRGVSWVYHQVEEKMQLSDQLKLQKRYYMALADNVAEVRRSRHDLKHHITAIDTFVNSSNIEGLRRYMQAMWGCKAVSAVIPYTGNAAADGVIYHYMIKAQESDICFEAKCSLYGVKLPDVELCSLLGNALDNAVTACREVTGKRSIQVTAKQENDMLILTVDNTFNGILMQEGDEFLSSKRDGQPGIGIPTMRSICFKHGGTCSFRALENKFEAGFLLKCE